MTASRHGIDQFTDFNISSTLNPARDAIKSFRDNGLDCHICPLLFVSTYLLGDAARLRFSRKSQTEVDALSAWKSIFTPRMHFQHPWAARDLFPGSPGSDPISTSHNCYLSVCPATPRVIHKVPRNVHFKRARPLFS